LRCIVACTKALVIVSVYDGVVRIGIRQCFNDLWIGAAITGSHIDTLTVAGTSHAVVTDAARAAASVITAGHIITIGNAGHTCALLAVTDQPIIAGTTKTQAAVVAAEFPVTGRRAVAEWVCATVAAMTALVVGIAGAVINAAARVTAGISILAIRAYTVVFVEVADTVGDTANAEASLVANAVAGHNIVSFNATQDGFALIICVAFLKLTASATLVAATIVAAGLFAAVRYTRGVFFRNRVVVAVG